VTRGQARIGAGLSILTEIWRKLSLNVAIVTNEMLHHKYFAAELNKSVNVRCILHPSGVADGRAKRSLSRGPAWAALKAMSVAYGKASRSSIAKSIASESVKSLGGALPEYQRIDESLIHRMETVNSPGAIELIRDKKIDVVCFLGGDIARKEFIGSAKLACLNLHSGLSPFYNGSSSSVWAVAEGRPNFSGVTLMHMNERIDGGGIVAHHLPSITATDTAASLFVKGICGAVELYRTAIGRLADGTMFGGIAQQRSFKYTAGMDWTIYQDLKLADFHKSGRMKIYSRDERSIFYDQSHLEMDFPYGELLSFLLARAKV
jgi:folate-dependent phosphoribosylglycinamide formyltransferase PurN